MYAEKIVLSSASKEPIQLAISKELRAKTVNDISSKKLG